MWVFVLLHLYVSVCLSVCLTVLVLHYVFENHMSLCVSLLFVSVCDEIRSEYQ